MALLLTACVTEPAISIAAGPSTVVGAVQIDTSPPHAVAVPEPAWLAVDRPTTDDEPEPTEPSEPTEPEPTEPEPEPAEPEPAEPQALPVDCRKVDCVALTFDDGPVRHTTSRLLDVLERAEAPATFFVLGTQAKAFPKVLARMTADGHEIGNHGWSHADMTRLSRTALRKQIVRTERAIEKATGQRPTLLRPPYGARDKTVDSVARKLGYAEVLWSVDTRDWAHHKPKKTLAAAAKAKPGAIVLLHDIHADTVDAVPRLIKKLRKQGYTLVTVSELLGDTKPGKRYYGSR